MTARPVAAFQHRRVAVVALQVPVPILVPADGVNAVVDGIGLVSTLLAVDRLKIHRSCKSLIDEIPGYSWSEPHAERGEDVPVKADDHGVDSLRYGIATTRALWQQRIPIAA